MNFMKILSLVSSLFFVSILLMGCTHQTTQNTTLEGAINNDNALSLKRPKAIVQPLPGYPVKAYYQKIEGSLNIKFDIDEKGMTQNIRIKESPLIDIFGLEVIKTIEKWRYEPGEPVKDHIVTIEFNMRK